MTHDPEWLAQLREYTPVVAQKFADGMGKGSQLLAEPGCPKGCPDCTRECAMRFITANWWMKELANEEVKARQLPPLTHAGVTYEAKGTMQ